MIPELERTPGIYLVGFMGCGKTTIGRLLAAKLGWAFVDIDDDIEARAETSISAIFESRGEAEFRKLEAAAIAARVALIERGQPTVVALGGGAFVSQANYEMVSANGVSVWLDCPLEILERRVARATHRPLARDPEKFAALYESRLGAYRRADFRIEIPGDDPQPVLERILSLSIF